MISASVLWCRGHAAATIYSLYLVHFVSLSISLRGCSRKHWWWTISLSLYLPDFPSLCPPVLLMSCLEGDLWLSWPPLHRLTLRSAALSNAASLHGAENRHVVVSSAVAARGDWILICSSRQWPEIEPSPSPFYFRPKGREAQKWRAIALRIVHISCEIRMQHFWRYWEIQRQPKKIL